MTGVGRLLVGCDWLAGIESWGARWDSWWSWGLGVVMVMSLGRMGWFGMVWEVMGRLERLVT